MLLGKGHVQFIESDPHFDYAVLQIPTNTIEYVDTFGYLQLCDSGDCHVGKQIYIPQYSHGFSKKIVMTDDDLDVRPASIKETNKIVNAENSVQLIGLVGYKAETEGDSSCSPVTLGDSDLVVVLRHYRGNRNSSTPSNLFVAPFRRISSNNNGFETSDS